MKVWHFEFLKRGLKTRKLANIWLLNSSFYLFCPGHFDESPFWVFYLERSRAVSWDADWFNIPPTLRWHGGICDTGVCTPYCLFVLNKLFLYFHFYALFDLLLKGMVRSCLLSEDELLTIDIDGVIALWILKTRAQYTKIRENWTSKF